MSSFCFRITEEYSDVNLTALYDLCEKVVVYQHDADTKVSRTHIHGLVFGCKRKEDTIRNKYFKGSYEYSLKSKVDESFITYMSKGKLSPVFLKGWSPEEIELKRLEWVEHTAVAKKEKEETGKKTKRELLEEMNNLYYTGMTDKDIIQMIRQVLCENHEVIGMYKVLDYYDSVIMNMDKTKWVDTMLAKINSRIRV